MGALAAPLHGVFSFGRHVASRRCLMNQSPIFWAAFWAGLAGPASLYAPPPTYYLYMGSSSVALSFAGVAFNLDRASGAYLNVGQPAIGQPAPAPAT